MDPASTDCVSQAGVGGHLAAYMLAKAHMALRNDAGAIAAYRRSLERNPRYRLALLELGLLLVRRQSAGELKQFLEPIVDLTCKEILVSLALVFSQGAYYREALDYLDMLDGLEGASPDSSQVAILRGECLLNLGQYRKAIIALNEVAWSSEHFVTATINKALCYFLLGEHGSAARSLDLIRGRSDFKLVYSVYRSLVSLIGEETVALVVGDGQKDEALNLVADAMRKFLELKEFDACEKAVVLLKHLGLESGEINLFLGKIYYDAGRNDVAVERLIASYESGYADGEAFFILGQTSLNEGFFDEAKIFFYEALNNGIEEYALYISLARTLIQLGQAEEALDVLNTGERKYPDAPLISEIKRSIGDIV
jgi:tetratricopeptide (TPR) repeat protein